MGVWHCGNVVGAQQMSFATKEVTMYYGKRFSEQ